LGTAAGNRLGLRCAPHSSINVQRDLNSTQNAMEIGRVMHFPAPARHEFTVQPAGHRQAFPVGHALAERRVACTPRSSSNDRYFSAQFSHIRYSC
jgi:hypothetical protein